MQADDKATLVETLARLRAIVAKHKAGKPVLVTMAARIEERAMMAEREAERLASELVQDARRDA